MTVAQQIAARGEITRWEKAWRLFTVLIAAAVLVMVVALAQINSRASDTAIKAKATADFVDSTLDTVKVATCRSRVTTLRTAPQTIRDYRALADAQSVQAKLVCPDLDYEKLEKARQAEVDALANGADPAEVALRPAPDNVGV